jgi:predicted DNA-binding transcriptional regulator YafY
VLDQADRDAATIAVVPPHRLEHLGSIDQIREAIRSNRWLRIAYRGPSGAGERLILPLTIFIEGRRWYLRAIAYGAAELRTYRIDRILRAQPAANPVDADAIVAEATSRDASVAALIPVRVRISRSDVVRLEVHPDFAGKMLEDPEGGELLFHSPESELAYFARELYALGPQAFVVEPPKLAALVAGLAEKTAAMYRPSNGDGQLSPMDL